MKQCLALHFSFLLTVYMLQAQDKWIVVTTIQYPTPQLKKLSQMEGWNLVVVGDKKTPADWHLDNCDYLSPEKQLSLGYKLTPLIPWNHYSRKNIGYLYAIDHGASIIYETDDDNEPIDDLQPLINKAILPLLVSQELCINAYHYFSPLAIWPRGYPLEMIHSSSSYSIGESMIGEIGIEQNLVNNDADVDAIFRLTQSLKIFFENKQACMLSLGVYCPFNSQNTFVHKKAFFTLYLPSFVTMRVSDIWRSYYAQKLMQLCNLHLAFSSPNAIQIRNDHNLMNDFIEEQDLYLKSMDFIKFLSTWNVSSVFEPLKSMQELFYGLVHEGLLPEKELLLSQAWLEDLIKIGYV